jgi:catechol-2,3-dioxygenase
LNFYSEVLGLRVVERSEGGEVLLEAGKGSQLLLYPGSPTKSDHTLACFAVAKIEDAIQSLKAKGIKMEDYDLPGLKTVNHISTNGNLRAAWFRDPEGNYLGLTQKIQASR